MVLFEYRHCDIPYMHKTEGRCTDNVGILRDYITALPKYLNPWYGFKHLPGLQSLKYEAHGISIKTVSAAKSLDVATDKLRGFSLFGSFVDECEFIPFMKAVIDGANPTVVQARETAKKYGLRTCMMYASTPGDLETTHGREWQSILDNLPRFNEQMYDLDREDIGSFFDVDGTDEEVARSKSSNRITMVYIEFNYKQLRKTEEWLQAQYEEAVRMDTMGEFRRGVLLQRFRGDNSALFNQADLDYMKAHVREPDYQILMLKKFTLNVYKHNVINVSLTAQYPYFDIHLPYMIGIDIASGKGGDNTAIIIVNPYTLEIIAEMKSSYMGTFDLMRIITELAKMMPGALFCPETNNIGSTVIEFVQETHLEARFFHDPKLDISKNAITIDPKNPNDLRQKSIERGYIGTYVTTTIRDKMFSLLKRYIHDYKELINTPMLVTDICNLVNNKGKIEAASGEHDDVVMAYNHILYVLNYGADLMRFGIDKRKCTFEKVNDVLIKYEEDIREETVNNMVPYENPNAYENQILHDLTSGNGGFAVDEFGRDEYGYRREDYDTNYGLQRKNESASYCMSDTDVSVFAAINAASNGW